MIRGNTHQSMIYETYHGNAPPPFDFSHGMTSSCLFFFCSFRDLIEEVLNLVNCKVLQYGQSATTDTYVLSESSMFVFRTHFVLKTCGETTLLHAVQPMLELAREYCQFDNVDVSRATIGTMRILFFFLASFL